MKFILAVAVFSLTVASSFAEVDVIYGQDNRRDLFAVTNRLHYTLARSTAGMVDIRRLAKGRDNAHLDLAAFVTLERAQNICPSERFSQQITAPSCTGFLVGPDTIVTAGHCLLSLPGMTAEDVCKTFAWVFDYSMPTPNHNPGRDISLNNAYLCKQVIAAQAANGIDFAVIKLNRPVQGRAPLKFRTAGKIDNRASLVVIGHPNGLPTKISDGGRVLNNENANLFATTLDTFHGNSGSPVFDAQTGLVEGILVMGKADYVPSKKDDPKSCQIVNKCDDLGQNCFVDNLRSPTRFGELVYRITNIAGGLQKTLSAR